MDLAKAFGDLLATVGAAGPSTIIFALFAGHLILDVIVIRASLREKNPLLVPGWVYQDKAQTADRATEASKASAQSTRDLTDALIRRSDDESRVGRNDRRSESPEQWRSGRTENNDRGPD